MSGSEDDTAQPENEPDAVATRLAAAGVRLVAITFVDNAGVSRLKIVPLGKLAGAAVNGVGISSTFAVFANDDHLAFTSGFDTPSGDMRLVPDLSAAVAQHGNPGWGWAPADQCDQEGRGLPTDQRGFLRRVRDAAASDGVEFGMSFEVEFSLFDHAGEPLHRGPGYSPFALIPAQRYLAELADALAAQGIPLEQVHPEYADGQYELSVAPSDPLVAADRYVLLRMTIRRLAAQHDLRASFAPTVLPGAVGNGCHLHFSAWRDRQNLMTGGNGPADLRPEGEAAAAGVLRHLPDLMAVFAPSAASYGRLQPSRWSGAYTCWGHENREAALRLSKGSRAVRARAANFELKTVDGTANPYLAAALLVAAARDGLREELRLPAGITADPATLSDAERVAGGIERLPVDLGAAIERLERSSFARGAMGEALHDAFVGVRRYEWDLYRDSDEPELIEQHLWRYG